MPGWWFSFDCLSLAELRLCGQVAFSLCQTNSKLDKDRQLWPSQKCFPADPCISSFWLICWWIFPVLLYFHEFYFLLEKLHIWGMKNDRFHGSFFGESGDGELDSCKPFPHWGSYKERDRFSCMTKFPKTRNSLGKSSEENVEINGAKSIYFNLWIVWASEYFFFSFLIFLISIYLSSYC